MAANSSGPSVGTYVAGASIVAALLAGAVYVVSTNSKAEAEQLRAELQRSQEESRQALTAALSRTATSTTSSSSGGGGLAKTVSDVTGFLSGLASAASSVSKTFSGLKL